jgi:lipoprotein-releasing system permease protein
MAIVIGNILGIGLALIQKSTGFIKLDETNYYLSEVPIHFDIWAIFGINIVTIIVTLLVMVIPSYMVTKISPIKILRFE